jgi:hypothetical protein
VRGETGCANWNPPGAGACEGPFPVSDVSANPPKAQASTADLSVVHSAPSPSTACVAPKRWSTGISFLDDEVKIDFLRRTVQLEGANKRRVTKKGGSNGNDT